MRPSTPKPPPPAPVMVGIQVRLHPDLVDQIDAIAVAGRLTRSNAIRMLLTTATGAQRNATRAKVSA